MPKILESSTAAPVGIVKAYTGQTAPDGWLLCSGQTVGNASSGATALASAYAQDLFVHLWTNFANTELAVSGGRGASALADFNANKTIALPDLRGRTIAGKDNMGGSTASRLTAGQSGITGTTMGATGGAESHTLSTAQMPSHSHTAGTGFANLAHDHTTTFQTWFQYSTGSASSLDTGALNMGNFNKVSGGNNQSMNHNHSISAEGSGSSHQNTQPTFVGTWIIKF